MFVIAKFLPVWIFGGPIYLAYTKGSTLLQQKIYYLKDIVFFVICFNKGQLKYDFKYIVVYCVQYNSLIMGVCINVRHPKETNDHSLNIGLTLTSSKIGFIPQTTNCKCCTPMDALYTHAIEGG